MNQGLGMEAHFSNDKLIFTGQSASWPAMGNIVLELLLRTLAQVRYSVP